MDHVNVVFGAGPVGRALVERLTAEGRAVRVGTRSGTAVLPAGVEVVSVDVSDPRAAAQAGEGAAVVYGCVGLDYRGWPQKWPAMMKGMLAAAAANEARFVFMDNLYMYGDTGREPRTEDMPLTSDGVKPAVRAHITRMWLTAHREGRILGTAVRASDFYGPGIKVAALGDYTFARILAGKSAQVFGNPSHPHAMTYVPDIARALHTIGQAPEDAYGQAWHVPNAPALPVAEILDRFGALTGKRVKMMRLTRALATLLGLVDGNARELKEMLYQWEQPFLVDHSKFGAAFWEDYTPIDEGLEAVVEWYRAHGKR